jgi:hypothetical protein
MGLTGLGGRVPDKAGPSFTLRGGVLDLLLPKESGRTESIHLSQSMRQIAGQRGDYLV